MSYIGQGLPADVFSGFTTDAFTGDGSATTFTLSKAPFSEDGLIVVINNVIQRPTTNFTVSGTTLTIVGTAVASGDVIYAIHTSGAVPSTLASKVDVNGLSDGIILDADGDTTISADTDDQIDFKLGGVDEMTMSSSGIVINEGSNDRDFRIETDDGTHAFFVDGGNDRIGIGTSSPDYTLHVRSMGSPSNDTFIDIEGNAADANCGIQFTDSDGNLQGRITYDTDDDNLQFNVNSAERMRISSAGNLLIAQTTKETRGTTLYGTGANSAFFTATGTNLYIKTNDAASSTTGTFITFLNNTSSAGSITCTNTTDMVYGGTSDYRLKENQTEISDGITKLKQLKPYDFNWKHDTSKKVQGFFAHEFAEVCPNGVVGDKDATETKLKVILDVNGGVINSNIEESDWVIGKENGTYPSDSTWEASKVIPKYQEMDASKAIPVLTAALKEAVTKIETLETKVKALEDA